MSLPVRIAEIQLLHNGPSTTGPVPVASYMRMCLTGDLGGYYTGAIGQDRDQFGVKGDFVTSPEISQVFGEIIAVWFIAEWMSQGRPTEIQLVEMGPGRGTLMDDMLRTIKQFPTMADSIEKVCMVEASPELRDTQKRLLCKADAESTQCEFGLMSSTEKYLNKPIVWAESLKSLPFKSHSVHFIVAHEFFDALPIHVFQSALAPVAETKSSSSASDTTSSTGEQQQQSSTKTNSASPQPSYEWREMMVAPNSPAAIASAQAMPKAFGDKQTPCPEEFQLILSSKPTGDCQLLLESSPRYQRLKQIPGSIVEVCPDAALHVARVARLIERSFLFTKSRSLGAALIIDYGTSDTVPANSLRGIRHHKRVSPLSAPGLVDLSADVDFTALAEIATQICPRIEVHGPVPQADFLEEMGIQERAMMLMEAAQTFPPASGADVADNIYKSWQRLVDRGPNGMGKVYKALAIIPENSGRRRPAGFGGDVVQQSRLLYPD
ncbi:hypothetical protein E4U55_007784 [Claviceps digitariae]|nr:hypothetical protein E4U55_007784 [Claviceps digitariae]